MKEFLLLCSKLAVQIVTSILAQFRGQPNENTAWLVIVCLLMEVWVVIISTSSLQIKAAADQ